MRSASLASIVLLAALSACAEEAEPSAGATPKETGVETCTSFTTPTPGTLADLDGDGEQESLALVDEGACHLLVGRNGTTPLETQTLELSDTAGIKVVTLIGTERQLLLLSGESAGRGGFQPYLVGEENGVIALVEAQGSPLIPFVATDGGALPSTARCNDSGGIDVVEARPSEPAGVIPTWDVTTTSYTLEGNIASPAAQNVDEGVDDELLREQQPDLFTSGLLLGDCSE
ncbi:MAG TPA: hypothetical protein VLI04_02870 [Nocardioidaceae bacterium]|nr:hypothetical protein [Nocardioidaceae bacterium]